MSDPIQVRAASTKDIHRRVEAFQLLFRRAPRMRVQSPVQCLDGSHFSCGSGGLGCEIVEVGRTIVTFQVHDKRTAKFRFEDQDRDIRIDFE